MRGWADAVDEAKGCEHARPSIIEKNPQPGIVQFCCTFNTLSASTS